MKEEQQKLTVVTVAVYTQFEVNECADGVNISILDENKIGSFVFGVFTSRNRAVDEFAAWHNEQEIVQGSEDPYEWPLAHVDYSEHFVDL